MRLRSITVGLALLVSALLVERPAAADEALIAVRDVPYGASDRHQLDIYTRQGASDLPVVLFVHGGGWRTGDKRHAGRKPYWLVTEGYVFVSVEYRLLPEGGYPASFADVAAAVDWVHRNIRAHGGDPATIFLLGHSSGAQLVALVATDERYLGAHGLGPKALAGVVAVDTNTYDLERLLATTPEALEVYLPSFGGHPVAWRDGSPIVHVESGKGIPPFLLLVAGEEPGKLAQTRAFERALAGAGVPAEVVVFPQETHGTINRGLGTQGHGPSAAVLEFLRGVARPPAE